jgi:hypothetical protein
MYTLKPQVIYFSLKKLITGKGLINDPLLDNSFQINKGLRIGRQLLLDLNEMGWFFSVIKNNPNCVLNTNLIRITHGLRIPRYNHSTIYW